MLTEIPPEIHIRLGCRPDRDCLIRHLIQSICDVEIGEKLEHQIIVLRATADVAALQYAQMQYLEDGSEFLPTKGQHNEI